MSLRLWPKDFEKKEHITREEKALLRSAARKMKDGHFVVGIDPLGMSTEKVHMGFYIAPSKGLYTFSVCADRRDPAMEEQYVAFAAAMADKLHERLLDSGFLIERDGEGKRLKFPYRHMLIFADEKSGKKKRKRIGSKEMPCDPGFTRITEQECRAIFERLAPEYAVIINEKEPVEPKEEDTGTQENPVPEADFLITGKELEYKTFLLDEYQVALVNDMGKGHRVLLANPGAGKSVLLLSKAFKYASLYKKSRVLLTCYNSNLADAYQFKRSCANFGGNHNLYILTFHKLVKKLFEECLHRHCGTNIATPEEIRECIDRIRSGEIKVRFQAIFIDEVQIFEPVYLELCYLLLEKNPDAVFLMAGDLNQTVRSQSRRGDAPWKKMNGIDLDFTGRVKYIKKNYRNSRQIGRFLNSMLCRMNRQMELLGMIDRKEFVYDSFQSGGNEGIALKIRTGISRNTIQTAVAEAIKEIVGQYKIGYSEIAVLFPYKENKAYGYYFLEWLTDVLDREQIPYSMITAPSAKGQVKTQYSKTAGIVLSTIDSSLGLDFRAVILAGLYPYHYIFTEDRQKVELSSWDAIRRLPVQEKEKVQVQIRKMYTACSRARDILYVLSDMKPGSPMELLLTGTKE